MHASQEWMQMQMMPKGGSLMTGDCGFTWAARKRFPAKVTSEQLAVETQRSPIINMMMTVTVVALTVNICIALCTSQALS